MLLVMKSEIFLGQTGIKQARLMIFSDRDLFYQEKKLSQG